MDPIRRLLGSAVDERDGLVMHWSPGRIDVEFANGRHQSIRYHLEDGHYTFSSTVATEQVVSDIGKRKVARRILLRNRTIEVVGFRITKPGLLEAWIDQRAETLQRDELFYYVMQLAREADRLEFLLTGDDVH